MLCKNPRHKYQDKLSCKAKSTNFKELKSHRMYSLTTVKSNRKEVTGKSPVAWKLNNTHTNGSRIKSKEKLLKNIWNSVKVENNNISQRQLK